jgi:hypothetical protein
MNAIMAVAMTAHELGANFNKQKAGRPVLGVPSPADQIAAARVFRRCRPMSTIRTASMVAPVSG